MLKKSDLGKITTYERWDGFINLNYFSGWADNVQNINGRYEFYLRQTAYENQRLIVRLDAGEYIPSYFKEHKYPPVKIIGRVQQDPNKPYTTLIVRPIYLSRPSLIEMPTPATFYSIGTHGENYKTFNPFLDYDAFINLSFKEQQKAGERCSNKSFVAGIIKAKKKISNDTVAIELLCAENRTIPARLYGKLAGQYYNELSYLQPVLIEGSLHSREDKENNRIEAFIKVSNLTTIITPGKHIPKKVPEWYIRLQEQLDGEIITGDTKVMSEDTSSVYSNENTSDDGESVFTDLKFDPNTGEPLLKT
jgi:hypothetical protein